MNINNYVWLKLTKDGQKVVDKSRTTSLYQLDNGWSRFQLWNLMNIFGGYMHLGNNKTYFENNEIFFQDPTK